MVFDLQSAVAAPACPRDAGAGATTEGIATGAGAGTAGTRRT
jgi:hypothetical protein